MSDNKAFPSLGVVEHIDNLKSIWPKEEHSFTPWLAENIDLLGNAVKMTLKFKARESKIGNFELDILAEDTDNDNAPVVIENQLSGTDHAHLGKLLTYAAGSSVESEMGGRITTTIWIATSVRDEHRKAVEWLNQISGERARFFLVRIDAIRIGDSQPAPLFEVEVAPNDWASAFGQIVARAASDPPKTVTWQDDTLPVSVSSWSDFFRAVAKRSAYEASDIKAIGFLEDPGNCRKPFTATVAGKDWFIETHGSASSLRSTAAKILKTLGKPDGFMTVECVSGMTYLLP